MRIYFPRTRETQCLALGNIADYDYNVVEQSRALDIRLAFRSGIRISLEAKTSSALQDRDKMRVFFFGHKLTNDSLETKGSIIEIQYTNNCIYAPGTRALLIYTVEVRNPPVLVSI